MKSLLTLLIALCCFCFAQGQATYNFTVDITSANFRILKSFQLSGGKMGVLLATTNNANIYYQVFNGNTRTVNVDLASLFIWPNSDHNQVEINAISASNDNVFITYNSSDGGASMTSDAMRYIVVNSSGATVITGQVNTTDPGSTQTRFSQLVNLSNGKVLILFSRSDNASYAFRIFNIDGTAVTLADNVFATAAALGGSVYTTQVGVSNTGRFLFSIYYYGGNLKGYLFNNDGTSVTVGGVSPFNVDPMVTNEYYNQKIIGLPNGNFVLFYGANSTFYYKVLSSSGSTVVNRTSNPVGNYSMIDAFPDNTVGSEGYYLAQAVARDPNNYLDPYSKVVLKKYDQSNVLQTTTELEGFMISPEYRFVAGKVGGYAYTYSYYKSFDVDNSCPGYEYAYPTGDADIKGVAQAFNTTLPVSLLSFTVKEEGGTARLQWKTASEQNSRSFIVQRSYDANEWQTIATIAAAGNSDNIKNYQFVDEKPGAKNYYRIIQIDFDNKQKFSDIVLASFGRPTIFKVYPNPAKSYVIIELPEQLEARIRLFNSQGQVIYRREASTNTMKLELNSYPDGVYRLEVKQNDKTYSQKILIQKQ